jgi:hypothetical protein
MRLILLGVFCVAAMVLAGAGGSFGGDKKPKYTIKEVMKQAHDKDGLLARVASGDADLADKNKLAEYYDSLCKCKSPAGKDDDWKTKTEKLYTLAKETVDGKNVSGQLLKAADCKACHTIHKKKAN